jgi:hypothetical protein
VPAREIAAAKLEGECPWFETAEVSNETSAKDEKSKGMRRQKSDWPNDEAVEQRYNLVGKT